MKGKEYMLVNMILLVVLGIDWATGFVIAGYVTRNGVSPIGYAFWQCCGPFVCLLIAQLIRKDVKYYSGSAGYFIVCGIIGLAIPNLLMYYSSLHVDSGILTVLANIDPIITYTIALLFGVEIFNRKRFSMVLLGMFGVIVLVWPSSLKNVHFNHWLGLSLFIPLCYSLAMVVISRFRPQEGNNLNYSMWMLFVASCLMIPLTLINGKFFALGINLSSGLIILEILLSSLGYVLMFIIIERAGPVLFAMVNGTAAISGLIYGRLLFKQSISHAEFIAAILIVIAIIQVARLSKINQ
jgi:drug/metabolite transporter (DMT)-like permease